MIRWMKQLPEPRIDYNEYKPFIRNDWFRRNYMWFAYGLMIVLANVAFYTGGLAAGNFLTKLLICLIVYPIHELCHILVAAPKGDIFLTHSGLYFWLTPDFPMRKWHFWLFISLPFIMLTVVPAVCSFFAPDALRPYLVFIAWVNAVIAGSDIINIGLILIKPNDSVFYRGFYKTKG